MSQLMGETSIATRPCNGTTVHVICLDGHPAPEVETHTSLSPSMRVGYSGHAAGV